MKINIVVPTHDMVPAMFAYDLAQLVAMTYAAMPDDTSIGVTFLPGTYIHKARQELMKNSLDIRDDFVLWLDSDMRFPKEALIQLIQRDVPLVGINYATRRIPTDPVAIKHIGLKGDKEVPTRLFPDPETEGLEEVEAMGFGVTLMRMRDFKNMPPLTQGEWFAQEYLPETDQWIGEDVSFCRLVRKKLGIRPMVDLDLSWACAHIGQFEYKLHHIAAQTEEE